MFEPTVIQMDYRLPDLENASRNHGVTLGQIAGRTTNALGLKVRFHDLRHFFASMLIAQGESPKYICDQLGHSSIRVTFDVCGHLFPQSREEAAAKLQKAMFASRRSGFGSGLAANTENTATDKPRHNSEKDG
jgi:hypothetical protein